MTTTIHPWGKADRKDVVLIKINNNHGLQACISNYGGILQSLLYHGIDLVLGYDTLKEYQNSEMFLGAMVGPIADRIAEGRFLLGDHSVQLPQNEGPDCNHSGPNGFHSRIWDWKLLEDGVELSYIFSPEETGFPGNLHVTLRYLLRENVLRLEYQAQSDRHAAVSMTNHSYFNLNSGLSDCRNHLFTVHADSYAEIWREPYPIYTGTAADVTGTPLDLRQGKALHCVLQEEGFPAIRLVGGLDHYFPVPGEGMREHALLECPQSGISLCCRSDAPGVLVYAANSLGAERGKYGRIYGPHWGICLETECFPNAVNFPHLQNQVLLEPGQCRMTCTELEVRSGS